MNGFGVEVVEAPEPPAGVGEGLNHQPQGREHRVFQKSATVRGWCD